MTIDPQELLASLGGLCIVLSFLGGIGMWIFKNIITATVTSALDKFDERAVSPLRNEVGRLHEMITAVGRARAETER